MVTTRHHKADLRWMLVQTGRARSSPFRHSSWPPAPLGWLRRLAADFAHSEREYFPDDPRTALRRTTLIAWRRDLRRNLRLDVNCRRVVPLGVPLDVVMPVSERDFAVLPYAIAGLRQNLRHPIGSIFLVASDFAGIQAFCGDSDCVYVDESLAAPVSKANIHYNVAGIDRSGWLFQQLIKLNADRISGSRSILALDQDTVLIRPQCFSHGRKTILNQSDEFHLPYRLAHERLLGERIASPVSFVSHSMLLRRDWLSELRTRIEEQAGRPWYDAILDATDRRELSGFSEFETYAAHCLSRHPREVEAAYWFNLSLPRKALVNFDRIADEQRRFYKSISFHWHTSETPTPRRLSETTSASDRRHAWREACARWR
jgi:hypothetical protein